jgi:hypothetical protein
MRCYRSTFSRGNEENHENLGCPEDETAVVTTDCGFVRGCV